MKRIFFASFYFCVCDLTRKIRKNKKNLKNFTYSIQYYATQCTQSKAKTRASVLHKARISVDNCGDVNGKRLWICK